MAAPSSGQTRPPDDQRNRAARADAHRVQRLVVEQPDLVRLPVAGLHLVHELLQHQRRDQLHLHAPVLRRRQDRRRRRHRDQRRRIDLRDLRADQTVAASAPRRPQNTAPDDQRDGAAGRYADRAQRLVVEQPDLATPTSGRTAPPPQLLEHQRRDQLDLHAAVLRRRRHDRRGGHRDQRRRIDLRDLGADRAVTGSPRRPGEHGGADDQRDRAAGPDR